MKGVEARRVLDALIQGVDPETGDILPSDALVRTSVIRNALLVALEALRDNEPPPHAKAGSPARAGVPWTTEEDDTLRAAFTRGDSVGQLGSDHGRTNGAIKSRLMRLGLLAVVDAMLPSVAVPEPTAHAEGGKDAGATTVLAGDPLSHELVARKGYALKVLKTEVFKEGELEVLRRYGFWLEALAERKILPSTPAQEHFCRVVRGEAKPETLYERAWMRLVGRREIEPELTRDFELADPGEEWFKREAHWRYQ